MTEPQRSEETELGGEADSHPTADTSVESDRPTTPVARANGIDRTEPTASTGTGDIRTSEQPPAQDEQPKRRKIAARSRMDPLALIAGLGALAVSAYVLLGSPGWVTALGGQRSAAGIAVLAGVVLLAASLRSDRRTS